MPITLSVSAIRPKVKAPTESILYGVDFTKLLLSAETISTVTISDSPTGQLTIGAGSANVASFPNDEGGTVAVGKGAQFRISGGTAGTTYTLTVTVTTSAGNTRVIVCSLQVRSS